MNGNSDNVKCVPLFLKYGVILINIFLLFYLPSVYIGDLSAVNDVHNVNLRRLNKVTFGLEFEKRLKYLRYFSVRL